MDNMVHMKQHEDPEDPSPSVCAAHVRKYRPGPQIKEDVKKRRGDEDMVHSRRLAFSARTPKFSLKKISADKKST